MQPNHNTTRYGPGPSSCREGGRRIDETTALCLAATDFKSSLSIVRHALRNMSNSKRRKGKKYQVVGIEVGMPLYLLW